MAGNNWYWRQESPYGTIGRTGQSVTLRARDPRMQTKPANGINEDRCARRREEILAVAARLFAERGFSNTDTQDIADQLQVGKGTLYRYFPTKRELFLAAADRVMREMRQRVDASIAGVADPLERLSQGIRAFLSFYTEHPQYVELLIQERAQFKDREKPTFLEHRDANVARWREFYRKLIGEGRVRDIPVERITDVVSNLLYGAMFTNYFAGRRGPVEDQVHDILDIVFHGILSEPERKRRNGQKTA
jgi:AcrR family transcriptional regulator